jgi:hypothetical protein
MILGALQERQVMDMLARGDALRVEEIARRSTGNPGYLHVALRCLAQQGWLRRTGTPGTGSLTYQLNATGKAVLSVFPLYCDLIRFLRPCLPLDRSLFNGRTSEPHGEFRHWVDQAVNGWFLDQRLCDSASGHVRDQVRHHLDGILTLPIMLALWNLDELRAPPRPRSMKDDCHYALRFLHYLGWFDLERCGWTDEGRVACNTALHYGMVGSYYPMLVELETLLFGTHGRRTHNAEQDETHVDRRLNVLASSSAHKRYFVDADEIFIDIFNREPIAEQPEFVADNGCGDGSWLKHIHQLIIEKTKRGKHLAQYPLLMVGADYNAVARDVSRKTLADASIPSLVLFGDITDPTRFARDLRQQGLDIRRGLHIRAFIDHNRRYQQPERNGALNSPSTGAYIDEDGQPIPNHLLEQDLVLFLERWVPYVSRHGLVLLEAHCVDPQVAARHAGETHNITFDTYHGFSLQYPIDFETFMEAACVAGLSPVLYHQRRYPSRRPFVSISNNYFTTQKTGRPIPNGSAQREGDWRPEGSENLADGEALHRLLYHDGDLRRPKGWCSNATALLVREAFVRIEQCLDQVRTGQRAPEITIMDYGTGTGFAVIELLKACKERGLLRRLDECGVKLEIHMLDIPSGWFAKGYELLKDCRYVRFASIRSPATGAFLPLPSILGRRRMDLVIASMVFHLVPPNALPKLFAGLADVLDEQGILVWSAPDIGPAPPDAVLFHEPNRMLRRRFLEILQDPSELSAILASLSITERRSYEDLAARVAEIGDRLTPQVRAERQAAADRQILPVANDMGEVDREIARSFVGEIFSKHFEMRPSDSLEAILVPSNQRYLPEVDDLDLRRRITSLLMNGVVLPALRDGPAATTYGFSLHWTFGVHRLRRNRRQ